jgi:hypothetical protein
MHRMNPRYFGADPSDHPIAADALLREAPDDEEDEEKDEGEGEGQEDDDADDKDDGYSE